MRAAACGITSGLLLVGAARAAPPAEAAAPLALVALAPLLAAATGGAPRPCPRRAALAGLLTGGLYYGHAQLPVAAIDWGPAPVLAAVAALVLAAGVAAWAGAVAALALRAGPRAALAAAPLLWVLFEALVALPSLGASFLGLATLLTASPSLLVLAPFGGGALVAAWAVACSATLVALAHALPKRAPLPWPALVLVLAPLAVGLAGGSPGGPAGSTAGVAPTSREDTDGPADPVIRVAAVQPVHPTVHRHDPARLGENLRDLLVLSREAGAGSPDLLVWPETAWNAPAARGGAHFLGLVAHQLEVPLVSGVRRIDAAGALRNSVLLAEPDGTTRRVGEKQRPVPGYEGAPEGPLGRALARAGLWPGRIVPGPAPRPFELRDARGRRLRLGVLVCFDLQEASLGRRLRREGASLLLVLANEADLGRPFALAGERLARLRAAELGMPVVRVANTGRSLWIDGRGRTVAALPPAQPAAASAALPMPGAAHAPLRAALVPPGAVLLGACALFGIAVTRPSPRARPAAGARSPFPALLPSVPSALRRVKPGSLALPIIRRTP